DRGRRTRVLHTCGGTREDAGENECVVSVLPEEAHRVPACQRQREDDPGLDERRRREPYHERLREEDRTCEQSAAAAEQPGASKGHGRGGAEREQQRSECSLNRVPEQEPVEDEHLDGRGLVRLPRPAELEDPVRVRVE